ncbi:hypothetical protein [Kitasatospora sp. A2-31]|uniref:hypothetical protein n=1 Tax=Kitasatospora sp. A2-31 TaxID=2916414 RepID=UPI001EEB93DF|nr:hypothetical protein [Kitasatospora sp. A2-31]
MLHQVGGAGGPEALARSAGDRRPAASSQRQRLTDRGGAVLTSAGELVAYLRGQETDSAAARSTTRSSRGATPARSGATAPAAAA